MNNTFYWIAVALIITVTTSRLMRLWTYDDFPPVAWARDKYLDFAEKYAPSWAELGYCPWCVGFWIALGLIGLGYPADLYEWTGWTSAWWTLTGALSASYLGAMLMVRDGDKSRDRPDSAVDTTDGSSSTGTAF